MLANRASLTRALRSVIRKLQKQRPATTTHRRACSGTLVRDSSRAEDDSSAAPPACGVAFGKDAPMRELKKLYGLIEVRSRRESAGVVPFEADEHTGPPTPANHDRER